MRARARANSSTRDANRQNFIIPSNGVRLSGAAWLDAITREPRLSIATISIRRYLFVICFFFFEYREWITKLVITKSGIYNVITGGFFYLYCEDRECYFEIFEFS